MGRSATITRNRDRSLEKSPDAPYIETGSEDGRAKVHILENGVAVHDPVFGREVERQVLELLTREDMTGIEVRFRLCRDEVDDIKFICKVDYPGDIEHQGSWRWWSPLMSTPGELRRALEEGLELRRQRNGSPRPDLFGSAAQARPRTSSSSRSYHDPLFRA